MSLDFELLWGRLDKANWRDFDPLCRAVKEEVQGRLLELFHEYGIRATWCTVGRLFLNEVDALGGTTPGLDRLRLARLQDRQGDRHWEQVLYGRDLVRRIQQCPTQQEIGSHTFSHVNFATCSRERAKAELQACVDAAGAMNIRLRSFVFPRNRVGHLDLLPQYGFRVFRGPDPMWHESARVRDWRHRVGHLLDVARTATPPTVMPEWNANGLWDVKGSMLYTPSYGFRRHIPVSLRVNRALKGLQRAERERQVFHLWFHPSDVAVRQQDMLGGLRQILETAAVMQAKGQLDIAPMGEIPALMTGEREHAACAAPVCV